ncbi:MAG TPA: hypothetical protein VK961_16035 [Chthoniobacter sp.]|nr:hypothetical protein [Chthoniobacter sp.]
MTATLRPGFLFPLLAAALLPTSGWAHATDFILVKVSPHAGRVDVELTADYGGNPMFTDKAEAQAVLTQVLRVRTGDGGSTTELATLAPLRFEDRRQFDPTAPIPLDPTTGAEAHQLLTAVWSWNCGAQKIAFEMPADSNQSVILWTSSPSQSGSIQAGGDVRGGSPEAKPRWVFLLPGEVSPQMVVPPRSATAWLVSCASAGLLGISATVGFSLAAKRRRSVRA